MKNEEQKKVNKKLDELINNKLSVNEKKNLHNNLGISKKMLTVFLREPKRLKVMDAANFAEILNLSLLEFYLIINPEQPEKQ